MREILCPLPALGLPWTCVQIPDLMRSIRLYFLSTLAWPCLGFHLNCLDTALVFEVLELKLASSRLARVDLDC
jgi:hypothetical protein